MMYHLPLILPCLRVRVCYGPKNDILYQYQCWSRSYWEIPCFGIIEKLTVHLLWGKWCQRAAHVPPETLGLQSTSSYFKGIYRHSPHRLLPGWSGMSVVSIRNCGFWQSKSQREKHPLCLDIVRSADPFRAVGGENEKVGVADVGHWKSTRCINNGRGRIELNRQKVH